MSVLVPQNIFGFILNIPSDFKFGYFRLPFQRKHWIAFCKIRNAYYNLDSKLQKPKMIGDERSLIEYLQKEIDGEDRELIIIVNQEVEQLASWKSEPNTDISSDS